MTTNQPRRYATRDEAIEREITAALGDYANDFDIPAIADEVITHDDRGYAVTVTDAGFWRIVEAHHRD